MSLGMDKQPEDDDRSIRSSVPCSNLTDEMPELALMPHYSAVAEISANNDGECAFLLETGDIDIAAVAAAEAMDSDVEEDAACDCCGIQEGCQDPTCTEPRAIRFYKTPEKKQDIICRVAHILFYFEMPWKVS